MKDLFNKCDIVQSQFQDSHIQFQDSHIQFRISNFLPNIGITHEQMTFSAVFANVGLHFSFASVIVMNF